MHTVNIPKFSAYIAYIGENIGGEVYAIRFLRPAYYFYIFWRCFDISAKEHQINEEIKVSQVRLIGANGEQMGIVDIDTAQNAAYNAGYDLVLIAPNAEPPVCRIMDYGKFRFEKEKSEKDAKKRQQVVETKEIQLSCTIGDHDLMTKLNHALRFLKNGDKVKVVIRFKGREMSHMDIGRDVLNRFIGLCAEYGNTDKPPVLNGRYLSAVINPVVQK